MRFKYGDEVIERIGDGENVTGTGRVICAVRNNGTEVGVNGAATGIRWYDSLTGRRIPSNEGQYRAIHSARYRGKQ